MNRITRGIFFNKINIFFLCRHNFKQKSCPAEPPPVEYNYYSSFRPAIHFPILFQDNTIFPYLLLRCVNDISPAINNNPYLKCWWAPGRKALGDSAPTMGKYGIQAIQWLKCSPYLHFCWQLSLIWKYFSGNSRRSLSPTLLQIICKFRVDYLLLPWHKKTLRYHKWWKGCQTGF